MLKDVVDALRFGALLRMSLDYSSDEVYTPGDEDVFGVRFEDAQLWLGGEIGPVELFIMAKGADANAFPENVGGDSQLSDGSLGDFGIRDAWARTELSEGLHLYGGQFKCPLVASGNVGYDSLIMIDRTRIGQLFSTAGAYQPGVALVYDDERFHAKLVGQNGADGIVDEFGFVARGELKLAGGASHREGALGAAEDLQATLGAGYFTDGSQVGGGDFGSAWAVDLYSTWSRLSLHAEIISMDEELATKAVGNASEDAMPYSATLGFLFAEDWEVAARYQDLDNDVETTLLGGGLNYYIRGHDLKLQFNVSNYDENGTDGTIFQLGLAIAVGAKP